MFNETELKRKWIIIQLILRINYFAFSAENSCKENTGSRVRMKKEEIGVTDNIGSDKCTCLSRKQV